MLLVCLLFFIKFNVGLIVFVLYFLGLSYNGFNRKINRREAIGLAILPIAVVIVVSGLLGVSFFSYIRGVIELVSGYNAVMYLDNSLPNLSYGPGAIELLLVLALALQFFIQKPPLFLALTKMLLFAISLYVLYKQSFVRADQSHVADFFYFLPLLVLCLVDLHQWKRYWTLPLLLAALWIPFQMIGFELKYPFYFALKFDKSNYAQQLIGHTPDSGFRTNEGSLKLPASIVKKNRQPSN